MVPLKIKMFEVVDYDMYLGMDGEVV